MARCTSRLLLCTIILTFLFSNCLVKIVFAAQEEIISGFVVKSGKNFVIEADDGDYIAKGKDVSKLVGKMVLVTGIITEGPGGDTIEIKSIEDMQEMEDNTPD